MREIVKLMDFSLGKSHGLEVILRYANATLRTCHFLYAPLQGPSAGSLFHHAGLMELPTKAILGYRTSGNQHRIWSSADAIIIVCTIPCLLICTCNILSWGVFGLQTSICSIAPGWKTWWCASKYFGILQGESSVTMNWCKAMGNTDVPFASRAVKKPFGQFK